MTARSTGASSMNELQSAGWVSSTWSSLSPQPTTSAVQSSGASARRMVTMVMAAATYTPPDMPVQVRVGCKSAVGYDHHGGTEARSVV